MRPSCLFALCPDTVIIFLTFDCEYVFIFCCVFQSSSVEEAVSQLLAKRWQAEACASATIALSLPGPVLCPG